MTIELVPHDPFDEALVANVHPRDWQPPSPKPLYHLVVIGAGTAGLVTAAGAAGLGAKVALVERELMGGDCLNVGCVPSKALIRAARTVAEFRRAGEFGVRLNGNVEVDFPEVMKRLRRLRSSLSPHDSAARFQSLGIDVFFGQGKFTSETAIDVGGTTLNFQRAVIATGARASRPDTPGLAEAGYLTNENVFALAHLPKRMAVIGAGPIGCELAQSFARFGSSVHLFGNHGQILPKENRAAAERVAAAMQADGVQMILNSKLVRVERRGDEKVLFYTIGEAAHELIVDEILIGVGRTPNVDNLGLEAAGVKYDLKKGVVVDDRLRTSNPKIFSAGDCCSAFKFTHAADAMARIAIQNSLFAGRSKVSKLVIPWATYTDPEIAHVGQYEHELTAAGIPFQKLTQEFSKVDRAVLEGDDTGLVEVLVKPGTDQILGATIVASHAGELIAELCLAVTHKIGLRKIASTIHPYPTQAEAIKKIGDAYNRTRLTPFVKKLFAMWFSWWG